MLRELEIGMLVEREHAGEEVRYLLTSVLQSTPSLQRVSLRFDLTDDFTVLRTVSTPDLKPTQVTLTNLHLAATCPSILTDICKSLIRVKPLAQIQSFQLSLFASSDDYIPLPSHFIQILDVLKQRLKIKHLSSQMP